MGFSNAIAASRSIAKLCACSACVPWEKFNRATSMPASSSLRIMRGERVAGPIVHTILEWRDFILSSRFLYTPLTLLFRDAKLRNNPRHQVHTLRERRQGKALVVAVHASVILFGERKRPQAVSLHTVQTELCRIGCSCRHERQNWRTAELLCARLGNRRVEIRLNR